MRHQSFTGHSDFQILLHHQGDGKAHSRLVLYDGKNKKAIEAIDFHAPSCGNIRRVAFDRHSVEYYGPNHDLKYFRLHEERTQCYAVGDSQSIGSIWARMKFAAEKLEALYLQFDYAANITAEGKQRFNCRSAVLAILYDVFKGSVFKNEFTKMLVGTDVNFGEKADINLADPLAITKKHILSYDMTADDDRRLRPYYSEMDLVL